MSIIDAAKDSQINIKTARGIKRHADKISQDSALTPSIYNLEERLKITRKLG